MWSDRFNEHHVLPCFFCQPWSVGTDWKGQQETGLSVCRGTCLRLDPLSLNRDDPGKEKRARFIRSQREVFSVRCLIKDFSHGAGTTNFDKGPFTRTVTYFKLVGTASKATGVSQLGVLYTLFPQYGTTKCLLVDFSPRDWTDPLTTSREFTWSIPYCELIRRVCLLMDFQRASVNGPRSLFSRHRQKPLWD